MGDKALEDQEQGNRIDQRDNRARNTHFQRPPQSFCFSKQTTSGIAMPFLAADWKARSCASPDGPAPSTATRSLVTSPTVGPFPVEASGILFHTVVG